MIVQGSSVDGDLLMIEDAVILVVFAAPTSECL